MSAKVSSSIARCLQIEQFNVTYLFVKKCFAWILLNWRILIVEKA